ncbi:MAG: hypothetical protein JWO06_720 [Bacteroidota bacterium]|nr:hypothetical protein [Bacteroidota bacterium]
MVLHVEYITDAKGRQKSVVVPQKEWDSLISDYQKTKKKLQVFAGIQQAKKEVELIKKGKIKKQTLREFLNGL